jgi:hypothetical protein
LTVVNRALLRGPQPYAPSQHRQPPPCLTVELFYDNVAGAPDAERLRDAAARFRAVGKGKKRAREATAASAPAAESSDSD